MDEQQILENTAENSDNKEETKGNFFGDFMEILESVVTSVFVVLMIFTFVARPVTVDGRSMMPTLTDKDRLIMRTCFYTPKNGDIVIVNNDNPALEKVIVKRVIATEGQTVDIDFDSGEVKVDGKVLQEDYINNLTLLDEGGHDYPVTVPENCVFVMGDNRMNSLDSRDPRVGFVPEEEILGKVSLRIFPFSRFGVPA